MEKLTKQFNKLEKILLILIPSYFLGRILLSLIFNI